jgi:hypothetical protein
LFEPLWIPPHATAGQRLLYLQKVHGEEQNVAFQAIFLQALGRLGFALGRAAAWDPESPILDKLDALDPAKFDYRARNGSDGDGYNPLWTNTMMKAAAPRDGEKGSRYTFNNVDSSIAGAYEVLRQLTGIDDEEDEVAA